VTLKNLIRQLATCLASPSSLRALVEVGARRPALVAYASPQAVLEALRADSSRTVEERDAILVALLEELRTTKGAVWQALLVLAFEPMLVRIRTRLGKPVAVRFGRSQADDLDQRVLLAFADAAGTLRIKSHAARALRLAVKRSVFEDEKREREAFQPDEFDEDAHEGDPFEVTTREKAAANEVVGILDAEGGAELRDMILATRAHGEALRAYVARTQPDRSETQRRTIERRLTAAANRLEQTLRKRARQPEQRRAIRATNAA